jgi:Ca2+-transporting ATPase
VLLFYSNERNILKTNKTYPFISWAWWLFDPLKPNIQSVIQQFYEAGIQVKIVTGDNTVTTKAIAEMAGIKNTENVMEGEAFMK